MKVVSLFTGAGGADLGFTKAGFDIVFANDTDQDAANTYENNFHFPVLSSDVTTIDLNTIPVADVVIGGPPCQSFSNAKTKAHVSKLNRSGLSNVIAMKNIVKHLSPKMFVCENVDTILNIKMLDVYHVFISWDNYNTHVYRLSTEDYGIPQKRVRLFFVGIRKDLPYIFDRPKTDHWKNHYSGWADYLGIGNNYVMLKRACGLEIAEGDKATYTLIGSEQITIRKKVGSWWLKGLKHRDYYGIQQRYLSLDEMKKLQGFPEDFTFVGNKISRAKQIGNAWSVPVAYAIAKEVKRCLELI